MQKGYLLREKYSRGELQGTSYLKECMGKKIDNSFKVEINIEEGEKGTTALRMSEMS